MGEALGRGLLCGLLIFAGAAFLLGIAGIAGLISLCVTGTAKTVCLWIAGISAGIVVVPVVFSLLGSFFENLSYKSELRRQEREFKESCTELIYAVEKCDLGKVKKLLKKKKDPNEIKNFRCPLTSAFSEENNEYNKYTNISDEIIEALLDAGADPNITIKFNREVNSPLKSAIRYERLGAVKLLVERGAIVDSVDQKKIDEIKKSGRDLASVAPSEYNYKFQPVQYAFFEGSMECANYLLDQNPYCTIWYSSDITLLMRLMQIGDKSYYYTKDDKDGKMALEIMDKLLNYVKKPDFNNPDFDLVNIKDEKGRTALHYFSMNINGHETIPSVLCTKLFDCGAKVNATDNKGNTALHYIAENWNFEKILPSTELLINHGANISIKNEEGKIPLEIFQEAHKWHTDSDKYKKIEELLTPKKIAMIEKVPINPKEISVEKTDSLLDSNISHIFFYR